jgi:Tfp pilus assembly protein PilF
VRVRGDIERAYKLENAGHPEQGLQVLNDDARSAGSCSFQTRVYTQIGRLELRMGDFKAARGASEEALRLHALKPVLGCEETGLNYFIIADSRSGVGEFAEAELSYKQAARVFETCGGHAEVLVARVYSDLAMIYVNERNLKAAEQAIEKSLAAEKRTANPDRMEEILGQQSLAHVKYQQGRISEALGTTKDLVNRYGADDALNPALRGSLYDDYGELCIQQGKLAEAAESLNMSATLKAKCPGRTGVAKTLARLAWVHTLLKQFDDAENTLKDAEGRLSGPAGEQDPLEAAIVAETYGAFLNARQQWKDARTNLLNALASGNSGPAFAEIHAAALLQLAEADHHLHRKQEEKKSRNQARLLQASFANAYASRVVDVTSLERSYAP